MLSTPAPVPPKIKKNNRVILPATKGSGGHCAPRIHRALGTVKQGIVRFSFSYFNTEEEVDKAIEAVAEISR